MTGSLGSTTRSTEFFQLDLSVNWTAENPAWANLKPTSTSLPISGYSGALLPNGEVVVKGYIPFEGRITAGIIDNQGAYTTVSLTSVFPPQVSGFPLSEGFATTASPEGDIYFFTENLTRSSTSRPAREIPSQFGTATAVWCPSLGTGGAVLTTKVSDTAASFSWLNDKKWETLSTVQEPVPAFYGHCLVKGGIDDKYYLFGGSNRGYLKALSGQLYVLDMKSRSFTKLGKATEKRSFMACAATKESFFAWGGSNDGGQSTNSIPLIFNFAVGDWVNSNIIPPPPPPPPPPPVINPTPDNTGNGNGTNPGQGGNGNGIGTGGNGKGNGNGNGSGAGNGSGNDSGSGGSQLNIAAIAGGAVGGIALIALVALIFFVVGKRHKSSKYDDRMYSSKSSSPRDYYSRSGRRDSRSSDSEKEYSTHCPEPLSAMHIKKDSTPKPLRKKRSPSSLRSESDQEYLQLEPLRRTSSSDLGLNSPKAKEYMSST
ncbi:hypothetical protein BGW38_002696, partial [Lunasporangiospora selenospora]